METIWIGLLLLSVIAGLSTQQTVGPLRGDEVQCLILERTSSQLFDNTCEDVDFAEIDVANIVSSVVIGITLTA